MRAFDSASAGDNVKRMRGPVRWHAGGLGFESIGVHLFSACGMSWLGRASPSRARMTSPAVPSRHRLIHPGASWIFHASPLV